MSKKVDIPKGEEKAPDIKTTVSGDARQEKPSQDIAEVIEYQTNNRLARMVEAGKNIAESIDDETDITFKASRENTAVEIKKYLKEIIAGIEKIEDRNIPAAIREDLDVLKGSLEDIEIDGLVAAVMTLARRAKKKNKKIAIGLETDWIPNYTKQKSMERDSVSLYVRGIGKTIEKELRKLGLGDSVIFKHETSEKLIDKLTEINNDGSTDLSEVVIMASNKTIETSKAKLDRFKIGEKEKRPFIASIDPSDIKVKGDNDGKVYTAKIMEMLSISLELAVSGKESLATSLSMVKAYNSAFRIIEFIPKIRPVDYAECVDEYKRKLKVLQAA